MMEVIYACVGAMLFGFAWLTVRDHQHPGRVVSSLFWFVLGLIFAAGNGLPAEVSGALVVFLVVLDATGRVTASPVRDYEPQPLDGRTVIPILIIPACTLIFSLSYRWIDEKRLQEGALLGLAVGALLAGWTALRLTDCRWPTLLDEGRRLNETIGAVSLLPQLLASLGTVFAAAGVGQWIAGGVRQVVPDGSLFWLIVANCLAMSALSALTGNSFAAFPIVATGILHPLILVPFGADPAALGILTLAIGASGTLVTPMAANFNLVPAYLLEMKNRYGVILYQIPAAAVLWLAQVAAMYAVVR